MMSRQKGNDFSANSSETGRCERCVYEINNFATFVFWCVGDVYYQIMLLLCCIVIPHVQCALLFHFCILFHKE